MMLPWSTWIPIDRGALAASIAIPREARGVVIFAHGSGSSRTSPRNVFVAELLQRASIGTVLVDLLTPEEEAVDRRTAHVRFDIALLAHRLRQITEWAIGEPKLRGLRVGYFGASTGAAAALVAAAARPDAVAAVVSRGGRPELAGTALQHVLAPVLFMVGERDTAVLELNRKAMAELPEGTERQLDVIAGATHLFEEPGTLEEVAKKAGEWFAGRLARTEPPPGAGPRGWQSA